MARNGEFFGQLDAIKAATPSSVGGDVAFKGYNGDGDGDGGDD
jgi:hypothetical protein